MQKGHLAPVRPLGSVVSHRGYCGYAARRIFEDTVSVRSDGAWFGGRGDRGKGIALDFLFWTDFRSGMRGECVFCNVYSSDWECEYMGICVGDSRGHGVHGMRIAILFQAALAWVGIWNHRGSGGDNSVL